MLRTFPWYLHLKCQRCWLLNILVLSAARQKAFIGRWNEGILDRFSSEYKEGFKQFNLVLHPPFSTSSKRRRQWAASSKTHSRWVVYTLSYVTKIKPHNPTSPASFFMQAVEFSCMWCPLELEIWAGMKKDNTSRLGEVELLWKEAPDGGQVGGCSVRGQLPVS